MILDASQNSTLATVAAPTQALVPVTKRGQATRNKLLVAAEAEFGTKGFHVASVSSITGRAGVGQGTFYLYFHTKEEIFTTLVKEIGRDLRARMLAALQGQGCRIARERRAVEIFYELSIRNRASFRIVQEAQFVDEAVFREFYERLSADYANSLQQAANRGEISSGDAEVRSWALLGMSHFVGLRNYLANSAGAANGDVDALMGLVANGISARTNSRTAAS